MVDVVGGDILGSRSLDLDDHVDITVQIPYAARLISYPFEAGVPCSMYNSQ
jgi:hypothetical protein